MWPRVGSGARRFPTSSWRCDPTWAMSCYGCQGSAPSSSAGTAGSFSGRADNGLWAVVSGILANNQRWPPSAKFSTGIKAVVEGLAAVSSDPETVRYENGDRAQYLDLTFLCRAAGDVDPWVADDESIRSAGSRPTHKPRP